MKLIIVTLKLRGHLAQSVEHLTFNQRVTGSSPVVPTTNLTHSFP